MDARERLRRYLEQRRELGETEFVLDAVSVEEAMRRLGVPSRGDRPERGSVGPVARAAAPLSAEPPPAAAPSLAAPSAPPPVAEPPVAGPPVAEPPAAAPSAATGRGWRDALAHSGAMAGQGEAPASPSEAASGMRDPGDGGGDVAGEPAPWPSWLDALGVTRGVARGLPSAPAVVGALASVEEVRAAVAACTGCALHRSARSPVPGEGPPRADLMCIGEAPGADEDAQGRPFVGEAGQLLTRILAAINVSRDDVFICNVLKHRPPGNRDPEPDEMQACLPFLWRQVALVRPRVILVLGRVAAQAVTGSTQGIGALRGRVHALMGIPVVATYHPAALLRNEAWKRPTWEDVQLAQRLLLAARAHGAGAPGATEAGA